MVMAVYYSYRAVLASLLISLLVLQLAQADNMVSSGNGNGTQSSPPNTIDCGAACATRCSLSSRPRLCNRACGTCCYRCKCVPPGTSGNLEVCPCYANMTTRDNLRKCP
ncbi:PREDICTED: gibberellin-regulated protein 1-like [Nelumbo nucifera]|uniref:Gibberellin-regulated protein 1-like n=1 Tax=Nelumbo nucifera TaxID=4432 RepID=A0A1U8ALQ5_NELNU|nr:PREDICTED: gibberellin-regulated protein 1-like [Nelumbo nucifera]